MKIIPEKYLEFGINQDKTVGPAHFKGMCGIELKLRHGSIFFEKIDIWQATSTSRFFCPTFAELSCTGDLTIGSMKLKIDKTENGIFVFVSSMMNPKRGSDRYSHFCGGSIKNIDEETMKYFYSWLQGIEVELESKRWIQALEK